MRWGAIGLSFHCLLKTPLFSVDCSDLKMLEMASKRPIFTFFFRASMLPDPPRGFAAPKTSLFFFYRVGITEMGTNYL